MFIFGFASPNRSAPDPANPQSQVDPEDELFDEEEESVGDEINATLAALMPWGISILFHVALVVVALFLVWQVVLTSDEEPPIVPSATLSDTPGAPQQMEEVKLETQDSAPTNPTPTPDITPPSPTNNPLTASQLAGMTFSGGAPSGGPFSISDGTGQFNSEMFGNKGGNATKIAFIVDASGSMVDVLPFVVNELKRVVNDLKQQQSFTIIFFSEDGVFEVPGGDKPRGLRSATPDFKNRSREWVSLDQHHFEVGGRGSVNVLAALEQALSYKPQLIYLLSDNLTGGGQGATQHEIFQDDLMAAIKDANDFNPAAKFNTIQFLYPDPLLKAGRKGTLDLIANTTGGNYKFVTAEMLNLR